MTLNKLTAYLDSQEFYDLMQRYRHAPLHDQTAVCAAFEQIKQVILTATVATLKEMDCYVKF